MKTTYWTESKWAKRLLPRPEAASSKEWIEWEETAKTNTPIRYFLVEDCLNALQDFIYYIPNKINDARYYLKNRYVTKTHALTSNLLRGEYHELDERILHSLFDELVNFIINEKGWMQIISHSDKYPDKKVTIELGLEYLEWETTLTKDYLDPSDPEYHDKTDQAIVAEWIIKAYNWWAIERSNRPDASDASGWSEYCNSHPSVSNDDFDITRPMIDKMNQLEKDYYNEDTEMLIQLIKYRNRLWT